MKSVVLCIVLLGGVLCQGQPKVAPRTEAHPRLKPFELHAVNSTDTVNLKKLAGKVVVFDFFFPTCGECIVELPRLCELEKKFSSNNFELYLVNIVPEQDSMVGPMFKKAGCSLPTLHTDAMPWAIHWIGKEYWGPDGAPETLLIDQESRIVSHIYMNTAKNRALADEKIAALLKSGATPGTPQKKQ